MLGVKVPLLVKSPAIYKVLLLAVKVAPVSIVTLPVAVTLPDCVKTELSSRCRLSLTVTVPPGANVLPVQMWSYGPEVRVSGLAEVVEVN